ncbi:MAG: hypothetical protein R3B81_10075 [bacterium]
MERAAKHFGTVAAATRVAPGDLEIWSLPWNVVQACPDPVDLADPLDEARFHAIALDLAGLKGAADHVVPLVDELQARGIPTVVYAAPADWIMHLQMEGLEARIASCEDLARAIDLLREYDDLRRRCTSDRGRRVGQLRMPAVAPSLAPLCAYARGRLEEAGVEAAVLRSLLRECYRNMVAVLEEENSEDGALSLSATVHDGRATLTLLDSGLPRENEVICPGDPTRVDRIHRFRILDRHNALVLEKDLPVG